MAWLAAKHVAVAVVLDLRPHEAGGVHQGQARAQDHALLGLGDRRLVADGGDLALHQGVHEGGFAHVGDAHDHHAQGLEVVVPMGCQGLAQAGDPGHLPGLLGRDGHRLDARLAIVEVQPGPGGLRVRQVGLVEQLEAGSLPEQAQLADHGIAAGFRQARVQHLDDHVDVGHGFGGLLARRGHVTGKPLDGHGRVK
jgi:hypothetical protein